jgi:membrane associated rhomboid family serine protease
VSEDVLPPAPAPTTEYCYRHPQTATAVHCTRCGRPICTECMIEAPVGFQCPECVAQARSDFRQGPAATLRSGGFSVTKALLVAIAIPFVLEIVKGGPTSFMNPNGQTLYDLGAMQPFAIAAGQYWRLFTAMFLHVGILHIAFNAYALWIFGQMVERDYGRVQMLLIYLVSGFLASVATYVWSDPRTLSVGASGAIFGIFGAFFVYNYRRRHTALGAQNIRTALSLLVLNAILAFSISGIDWRAHVGGFVAGVACGWVSEGWGPTSQRRVIRVVGYVGLVAIGIALVVYRTNELRDAFGAILGLS